MKTRRLPVTRHQVTTVMMAVLVVIAAATPPALARDTTSAGDGTSAQTACRIVEIPVEAGSETGHASGTLCQPPGATRVQLLVPGWTYNRHYWETPHRPGASSYVASANRAGYATLAIDRLGTGASLHPVAINDTHEADLAAVNGWVEALRDGSFGTRYARVIGVGHSYGSVLVSSSAGRYGGIDALITTGFAHLLNYTNALLGIFGRSHLANGDPRFARRGLGPLYMTSQPGTREIFYHGPNTHPSVVRIDEQRMTDVGSLVHAATLFTYSIPNDDVDLDIPVLAVTGDKDPYFCGLQTATCTSSEALRDNERRWYDDGAPVEAYAPENTGHNVTLELSAPRSTARMLDFSDRYVGNGGATTGAADGAVPDPPRPRPGSPEPLTAAANAALSTALRPLADAYFKAVAEVPGLGTAQNPVPALSNLLAQVANLLGRVTPARRGSTG